MKVCCSKDIDHEMKEKFQEFLREYTYIFIKNISNTKISYLQILKRIN